MNALQTLRTKRTSGFWPTPHAWPIKGLPTWRP
jgi:hypothetical protein